MTKGFLIDMCCVCGDPSVSTIDGKCLCNECAAEYLEKERGTMIFVCCACGVENEVEVER